MFLEDPSVLTKDKLKSELLANNVALPTGEHKKDVYVQLYLKNLTVQNRRSGGALDAFSSDEDLPPPVVANRSRSGRKATRKTDKPRPDEVDVSELTDEDLKDQLLKYGINAGPIVASTRKLYEKKLQKLLDQGPPEAALPIVVPLKPDGNQNGNTDSDQYSDKEEADEVEPELELEPEPEPVPVVEKRVRSRGKTPVNLRARRLETNRYNPKEEEQCLAEQEEEEPSLNVKRRMRQVSHWQDQAVPASSNTDFSECSAPESAASSLVIVDHRPHEHESLESLQEPSPLLTTKSCKPSSLTHSERTESSSHTSRMTCGSLPGLIQEDASFRVQSYSPRTANVESPSYPNMPKPNSKDQNGSALSTKIHARKTAHLLSLLNTTLLEEDMKCSAPNRDLQLKEKQQKITPFFTAMTPERTGTIPHTPVGLRIRGVEQRLIVGDQTPRVDGKDILKEMFPDEVRTPTGISATCRRPIRGAAGRPLTPSDFWLDEKLLRRTERMETTSYEESCSIPRLSAPLSSSSSSRAVGGTVAPPAGQVSSRRSFPVWVQLLLLSAVAGFLFFVYQAMETNQLNPFSQESAAVAQSGSTGESTSK